MGKDIHKVFNSQSLKLEDFKKNNPKYPMPNQKITVRPDIIDSINAIGAMNEEMANQVAEKHAKDEEARRATLYTAEHTKQTANEVARLNAQVSELSTTLDKERDRIKKLEKEKTVSEYSGKISTLLWSLLAFIITIIVFFFENDGISSLVSIILLVVLIVIHIGAIICNFVKMLKVKQEV